MPPVKEILPPTPQAGFSSRPRVLVAGHVLELSHLDKLYWPNEGITKGELLQYYATVGPALIPYLKDRPLTLVRFPEGITGESFYQKDLPASAPDWLPRYQVVSQGKKKTITYLLGNDLPSLLWAVNQGAIELHPWAARIQAPTLPDWAIIDLDPMPPADFTTVVRVAHLVRTVLNRLGLQGYPKTSGATGLHIYIPLQPRYSSKEITDFLEKIGQILVQAYPEGVTQERLVRKRGGKVYFDHLQNLAHKTIVAPYVVRPLPGAPVSTPLTWEELTPDLDPRRFHLRALPARLADRGDLFAPVLHARQDLTPALTVLKPSN